jgi:hypothetical protein
MGSDSALDAQGDIIIDICGIDYDEWLDSEPTEFRKIIESNIPNVVERYEGGLDGDEHLRVLGVIIMSSGSRTTRDVIDTIISAADQDDASGYINPEIRETRIQEFKTIIENYELDGGQPTEIPAEGLFEKMFGEV